jgi:thiosulfate/3-mercaptopyruvate sulfurtransferase
MLSFVDYPLVETEWLAAHLTEPNLRVVDARWRGDGSSRDLYQAGHIPGAVHLDWHLDLNHTVKGVRDLLLPPDRFAEVMAVAGIGDDTLVVAYAETDHSGAARLWWALRYYGHEQVGVLNGGLTKWLAEQRPLSTDTPRPSLAHFTPRPQPQWLATAAEIKQVLDSTGSNTRLVDTRPYEQYAGQAVWTPNGSLFLPSGQTEVDIGARRPIRAGHIPGAVHLHASANLNPADWTYLAPDILRARAEAADIQPEQHIITYCGVGISASLGLFALYLAGYRQVALYDASWEEWGTDPALPVARLASGQ